MLSVFFVLSLADPDHDDPDVLSFQTEFLSEFLESRTVLDHFGLTVLSRERVCRCPQPSQILIQQRLDSLDLISQSLLISVFECHHDCPPG
jgi:hypothetical protein